MEDVSIQTDHVGSQEILNLLIQRQMEENHDAGGSGSGSPNSSCASNKRRRYSKGVGIMKHYNNPNPYPSPPFNQSRISPDPDAIHRLADIEDSRSDSDVYFGHNHHQRLPSTKIKQQHLMASEALSPPLFPPSPSSRGGGNKPQNYFQRTASESRSGSGKSNNKTKDESEVSLSDRICQAVWSRKESAPFVSPLGLSSSGSSSRRHSSARRGTAPSVPPMMMMRQSFDLNPDAFGRSQSFKGSSSSGSVKNRISFRGDPLTRRASGDGIGSVEESPAYSYYKSKKGNSSEGLHDHHNHHYLQQHFCNSAHSSAPGSGQNLSISFAPQPHHESQRKSFRGRSGSRADGESLFKRQMSMTLSIPSREDSIRSHTSVKSYGSYGASVGGNEVKTLSSSPVGTTPVILETTTAPLRNKKLLRSGSNPDIFPSRRAKWKKREEEILFQANSNFNRAGAPNFENINGIIAPGGGGSGCSTANNSRRSKNTSFKSKQKKRMEAEAEENKANEKVACAVQLGFSSLLIISVCCTVIFLRYSATSHSSSSETVRKENENLWKSIQHTATNATNGTALATTPSPSSSNTQQVPDNSNIIGGGVGGELAVEEGGVIMEPNSNDKSISSSSEGGGSSGSSSVVGQSLTKTLQQLPSSSSRNILNVEEPPSRQHPILSNNDTAQHHHRPSPPSPPPPRHPHHQEEGLDISSRGEGVLGGGGPEETRGSNRSNNYSSNKFLINSSQEDRSFSTNSQNDYSVRPKRSRPRNSRIMEEQLANNNAKASQRTSNLIVSVLNNANNSKSNSENGESSSGGKSVRTKTRHLEGSLYRFLRNSGGGQGQQALTMRERRYPSVIGGSRKL